MGKRVISAFFTATLVLSFFLLPSISEALTVGPAKMEYKLDPGDTASGIIFLMNESEESRTLYPSFEKFIEVNGAKEFLPGEHTDLPAWFEMPESVSLAAGESRDIPFTLKIPEDAAPGGHFAVIWWGTAPPNAQGGAGTSIVTRAGILVYLNVSGDIQESGRIGNFSAADESRFFSRMPVDFNVVFENTGNVYLKPNGEIRIKNILGITSAVITVNGYGAEILPKSKKTLVTAPKSVRWGGFGFGFYKAVMTLNYGGNNDVQVGGETWFFVVTWQIILPILLVILLILWISVKGIKKYNRWIVDKYAKAGNNKF